MVLGDKTTVDSTFEAIQKQVLLKHIGYLEPCKPQQFHGRNIDHFGNYCNLGLKDSYIDNMIEESGMNNCNSVNTPGIAHYKPTIEDEALLDHEQHKRYRRIVGKLQWVAYTRPDIAYSTKELARDLTAPTELSQKRVKHLLRYLHGTKHYKFTIKTTTTLRANTNNTLDLDVHVDADWAGCPTTRKSTSGFNIHFLGTTVAFGSRTQATIALSSAEPELYAICTGVSEGLHLRNFLLETNICSKLNLRDHTDSTAGKSIATPANEQNTSTLNFSTQKVSSSTTSSESSKSTHYTTAQTCSPNTSAKKHYRSSYRALAYAFSTTNNNCFTTVHINHNSLYMAICNYLLVSNSNSNYKSQ